MLHSILSSSQQCKPKLIENEGHIVSKVELFKLANQNGLVMSLSFKLF